MMDINRKQIEQGIEKSRMENHKSFGGKRIHACLMPKTWRKGSRLMFCDGICWNSLLFIESIIVRFFYWYNEVKTTTASGTFHDITLT